MSLTGMGLILNAISPLLPSCWGFSALDDEVHLEKVKTFCKGLNVIPNSVFTNSSKKVGTFFFK